MPIKPYLAERVFPPGTVAAMNAAFTEACRTLGINTVNPSRAMLAHTIIHLVEAGITDADQLAAAAVTEFGGPKR